VSPAYGADLSHLPVSHLSVSPTSSTTPLHMMRERRLVVRSVAIVQTHPCLLPLRHALVSNSGCSKHFHTSLHSDHFDIVHASQVIPSQSQYDFLPHFCISYFALHSLNFSLRLILSCSCKNKHDGQPFEMFLALPTFTQFYHPPPKPFNSSP
jgi:hypothetical protein